MKLGIYLNSQHPVGDDPARRFDETLEQVRLVRSLGFDSIWAGEHHITPGFHFFPQLPLLHRLAGEAEGLWIGTNVTLLPLHNPVELAEAGAFLDVITGGKFLLGVGLGYRPEEYQIYGVPMSERVSRFTEAVEIIRRCGAKTGSRIPGATGNLATSPLHRARSKRRARPSLLARKWTRPSRGRPRSVMAGFRCQHPRSTRFTRRCRHSSPRGLRQSCRRRSISADCVGCAADDETAILRSTPFLMEKYKSYFSWGLEGLTLDPNAAPEQQFGALASKRFAVGAPASVIDMLVAQHRCGISHLSMRVSWPGMGQDEILASIELLGREVLPVVRRRTAAAGP